MTIRRQILDILCSEADAAFGLFFRCASLDDRVHLTTPVGCSVLQGLPGLDGLSGRLIKQEHDGWNLNLPDSTLLNRFSVPANGVPPTAHLEELTNGEIGRNHHHLQGLFYDEDRFVGTISLFREPDSAPFSSEVLERVGDLSSRVRLYLTRAERLETQRLREQSLFVVTDTEGNLLRLSDAAAEWVTDDRKEKLSRLTRRMNASEEVEAWEVLDRSQVHSIRLNGAQDVLYLASVVPLQAPRMKPAAMLTPRQREVAEYAAVGATVHEIAETLDISANTIKHHLKNIYDRLGIGSRVELARLIEVYSGEA